LAPRAILLFRRACSARIALSRAALLFPFRSSAARARSIFSASGDMVALIVTGRGRRFFFPLVFRWFSVGFPFFNLSFLPGRRPQGAALQARFPRRSSWQSSFLHTWPSCSFPAPAPRAAGFPFLLKVPFVTFRARLPFRLSAIFTIPAAFTCLCCNAGPIPFIPRRGKYGAFILINAPSGLCTASALHQIRAALDAMMRQTNPRALKHPV